MFTKVIARLNTSDIHLSNAITVKGLGNVATKDISVSSATMVALLLYVKLTTQGSIPTRA